MRGLHRAPTCLRPIVRPSLQGLCRRQQQQPVKCHGSSSSRGQQQNGGSNSSSRRSFHYQPQQPPPYYPQPYHHHPKKPKSRIVRDMALGSALTVAAYFAYTFYRYRQVLDRLDAEVGATKQLYAQFARRFAEAREAGDHDRIRELTFDFVRHLLAQHSGGSGSGSGGVSEDHLLRNGVFEAGPLPPFPEDDELHGKDRIPAEDTLMFVESDEDRRITAVQVAVNLDFEEVEGEWSRRPDRVVDPADDKLGELLTRFEYQVELWRKQDRLEGGHLLVMFGLRDRFWTFTYTYDPWDSVHISSFD